jgi:hypothetical protein
LCFLGFLFAIIGSRLAQKDLDLMIIRKNRKRKPSHKDLRGRRFVITLLMSLALSVSFGTMAQNGGLFGGGPESKGYEASQGMLGCRGTSQSTMSNQGFGESQGGITNQGFAETPIGNGLLVLMMAGAGYAIAKTKRKQKQKM